jgi:predicted DNA repair protein MutK
MAASSLLTLIDDIASVLDDIALMTKVAAKKTSAVLGDDLALNAQQVSGVKVDRELPVVWAVAKGSLKNKLILVPAALLIGTFAPWGVTPLLMLGGAFLCYEGFEKLAHTFIHRQASEQDQTAERLRGLTDPSVDLVALEQDKIKGAVRTDFVLSAEIIVITLGTVAAEPFASQLTVLTLIAVLMTFAVYGLVAGIVKLDDAGLYLSLKKGEGLRLRLQRRLGAAVLGAAPYLMKSLSVIGTAAMFLVGGGILTHGIPAVHTLIERLAVSAGTLEGLGAVLATLTPPVLNGLAGVVAGALVLAGVSSASRVWRLANK